RQITDSQRNALAAHLAENPRTRRCKSFADVTHRDRPLHTRPEAPGRDDADRACGNLVRVKLSAAPHGNATVDFQSDTASWCAVDQLAQNDLCAGKTTCPRPAGA